nr:hypothetical protein [Tanacetum cinerariifolium]
DDGSDDGNDDDNDETVKDGSKRDEDDVTMMKMKRLPRLINQRIQKVVGDTGVESIFTMASSPIVSLQTPTPIMTPSTIATITTSRDAPIPP